MSEVKKVKLHTKSGLAGQSIIVPILGAVEFAHDSSIEVEESQVEAIIQATKGSINLFDPTKKETEEVSTNKEYDHVLKLIAKLTGPGLLSLVKYSGIETNQAAGMSDTRLRAELNKRASKLAERYDEIVRSFNSTKRENEGVLAEVKTLLDKSKNDIEEEETKKAEKAAQDETDALLSTEANAKHLTESIAQHKASKDLAATMKTLDEVIENSTREELNAMALEALLDEQEIKEMGDRKLKNELLKIAGFPPKRGR